MRISDWSSDVCSSDLQARQLGLMLVPELELGYSMGGGSIFNDYRRTGFVPFHREWLRSFARGSLQDLFVARGEGDSMTPTLLDGDIVLIDTAPEGYWAAGPHLGACIWRSRDDQESPPLTRWNLSPQVGRRGPVHGAAVTHPERPGLRLVRPQGRDHALQHGRSEEHTSELQSLMRISYAVFCLKQKKNIQTYIQTIEQNNTCII